MAHSEPSVSRGHVPILIVIVLGLAVIAGYVPHFLRKRYFSGMPRWAAWTSGVVLFLATALGFGPAFVALMSIIITGRTM